MGHDERLRQKHIDRPSRIRGSSSVVEHRLAKARVASSNLVFRSILGKGRGRYGAEALLSIL